MLHRAAPDDEAEVVELFEIYESALVRNDVAVLDAMFVATDDVLRFGIADVQRGHDELVAWRAGATPVDARRRITSRSVAGLAPGVVAVDVTFANGDDPVIGRQSQTWVRRPEGWRIARAHVSTIPRPAEH